MADGRGNLHRAVRVPLAFDLLEFIRVGTLVIAIAVRVGSAGFQPRCGIEWGLTISGILCRSLFCVHEILCRLHQFDELAPVPVGITFHGLPGTHDDILVGGIRLMWRVSNKVAELGYSPGKLEIKGVYASVDGYRHVRGSVPMIQSLRTATRSFPICPRKCRLYL